MLNKDITPKDENGLTHGWVKCYYHNGVLMYEGNYIHGIRDGYWEGYNHYSYIRYRGSYINGKKYGYWRWYDLNGKLRDKIYHAR